MRRQQRIDDQAIDWLIRRDEPDWSASDQTELDDWLEQSMAHKAAFWRAEHGWQSTDRIKAFRTPSNDPASPVDDRRSRWRWASVAALFAAIIGVGIYEGDWTPTSVARTAHYQTPIGGHRVVALEDGSKLELNTRTAIRTAVTDHRRELWIDAGEAFFDVAHREDEPFIVHAGRQTVTVLGTKFSVRRESDRTTVNVLEGRVRVDDGKGSSTSAAIITAGDTAISRGASTLITARSDDRVARALAWRSGMLSFDRMALGDVAAEFNRYNRVQLVVADAEIAKIEIGGRFKASNVDAFARLLRDAYGLTVETSDGAIRVSQ